MIKALKVLFNIGLILFFVIICSAEARAEVMVPKIIQLMAQEALSLTGAAPANSQVLIYLDGIFVGQTEAAISCSDSSVEETECQPSWSFQYKPTQKLADGSHVVMAVAQDKTSLVLSAPTSEIKFTVNVVPAPTLIAPNEKTATADLRPLITGLTIDDSLVEIFIDGVYNGETGILKNDSGTANFSYRPTLSLNRGWHKIQARAVSNENFSLDSNLLNFRIELPMPAPTIFKPVVNQETSSSRPFIVGLAKNDSKIKIYIDKKYDGELTVKNHESGTANFAYKPAMALVRGSHSVYTVAVDKRGKESSRSNLIDFSTKSSAIAQSAQEEKKEVVVEAEEAQGPVEIKPEPVVISKSSGTVLEKTEVEPVVEANDSDFIGQELKDKENAALDKIKSLIGADAEEAESDRGMINEGEQNQSKLKLNIVLFILFLLGIVAWLLWVNRELVKDRRAHTEAKDPSAAEVLAGKKANENKNNPVSGEQKDKLL